jgi:hypothetical protein
MAKGPILDGIIARPLDKSITKELEDLCNTSFMPDKDSLWCPSHKCKPGSQLLGVRQDDGTVAILPTPLPTNDEFINTVKEDPMPRTTFSLYQQMCRIRLQPMDR